MAKEGDLVNLLCSAQGEPPITFSWEKDQTSLDGFIVKDMPHRSSLLVVTMKDETSFGKYICNIQDRFTKTAHNISVVKLTAQEECEGCGNHLVGIIVLIILLVILLIIIAYLLFHRVHRLKSSSTTGNLERKTKDSSKDIYENPNKDDVNNYEQVENEQSTYTALKRPGKDEDDHVYSHLNQRPQEYENQKETGL
ncbi:nectin-4-like [Dendronephthya gigantea]|uniref:nectin-4-like n=1 Tax=Dendronephthya gigantea TaxID=151771 RepID=UPI0010694999|nr:nectin-4-like [Dendronephthya gigantea]